MQSLRLTHSTHKFFDNAWALYEHSFPKDERRPIESQAKIMGHKNYHFEIFIKNREFLGLLFWWGFDELRYLEHFATMPVLRGKGVGKKVLDDFMNMDARPILLEVEMPEDEISRRRIGFYERLGFILHPDIYNPPSFHPDDPPPDMNLMSYPDPISEADVRGFVEEHHRDIYSWNK